MARADASVAAGATEDEATEQAFAEVWDERFVATGIADHDGYGIAFIEAARQIKATLPHTLAE